MLFKDFEAVVKEHRPELTVYKHGEFRGDGISVGVTFTPNGKVYTYRGTYVDVLNRLGIKACYEHDIANLKNMISLLERTHGTEGFFGEVMDNTQSIAKYNSMLEEMLQAVVCS